MKDCVVPDLTSQPELPTQNDSVLWKQTAGSSTAVTPSSQGQGFSWQTRGVLTDGRFWGAGGMEMDFRVN